MGTLKQKLDQYKGKLTAAQIAAGMNAATKNAHRLAEDATQLLESGRYPSAASLAVLSIEESGKTSILRSMALAKTGEELNECWRDYRQHTAKNVAWILPDLVREGARKLEELAPIFDRSSDHPQVLDQVKQLGFYTDCLGKAHWSVPEEVIGKELAASLVLIAKVFTTDRETMTEEIDLWIEHIGPVWKGPKPWMENALIRWHKALRERGIEVRGDMEKFIRGSENERNHG